ncbi:fumarylacetoacetate hydrolase family protein [Shewanella saliphila]|uniref:2-keto-4-pentenoate hydratase n=1 Tax=Shewanella saliphila TaxID=2282698 RepID=A0ABQ2Q8L2_9GAMM|nr:fumarylacetoacetate hydrolase family protein [Shewanella saliphila]MCL1099752.1 fumarylacetoacetate hydrolase family protein [Shewanella saliphila]GGP62804.1 2-keto-4-pentenoate hydratase [Shewanella saliphila]
MNLPNVVLKQAEQTLAVTPSKIVCIGRNYVDHIHELGNDVPDEMVVFLKPSSAITGTLCSEMGETLHYEAELCFMVKDGQFSAVGVGLDMTKRELQGKLKKQGLPWERSKAFDGSALFSEFIPMTSAQQDWCFQLTIDNQVAQLGHQQLMTYQPNAMFAAITEFMSLNDGDIVMTGTPKGVGAVSANTSFEISLWPNVAFEVFETALSGEKSMTQLCGPAMLVKQWQAV